MSLYSELYSAVKDRYDVSNKEKQEKTNKLWKDLKSNYSGKELQEKTYHLIKQLKEETTAKRASVKNFFIRAAKPNPSSAAKSSADNRRVEQKDLPNIPVEPVPSTSGQSDPNEPGIDGTDKRCNTPVQDATKKKIENLDAKIKALITAQNSGLAIENAAKQIKMLKNECDEERKKLKRKQGDMERQKKSRAQKKARLKKVCETHPDVANILKVRADPGRPRIEEGQPQLMDAIIDIAIFGSGADDRRRTEMIRTCKTLPALHKELESMGFELSQSALYTRLIPRRTNSSEGKRHVKTVPVKLVAAQTSQHKQHADTEFCVASIRALEALAAFLGSKEVFFLSQDDKARIPLGITAAHKQQSILMHLDYRVILPDHDFPKAPGHKLIPSVYASCGVKDNKMDSPEAVGYSGPTYIAIRSAKHSSSSALTHANDIDRLLDLDIFKNVCRTETGEIKPVMIISVDGGPDENVRYDKVIKIAIQHFKNYNLDALFVVTNAPGRSAFNRVERRMAPLSRELSGLLLSHDHFGSHLNSGGETIDVNLEKQNFKFAAEVLCDIWKNMTIDGFDVEASYIDPEEQVPEIEDVDPVWHMNHVQESQYLLQISKCNSPNCCSEHRSNLRKVLRNGFLPPPMKISNENGLVVHRNPAHTNSYFMPLFHRRAVPLELNAPGFKKVPYDLMCPSIQSQLLSRSCQTCGAYFATQQSAILHKRVIHQKHNESAIRVHPVTILTRRDSEVLCITRNDTEEEDLEWIDVEELDPRAIEEYRNPRETMNTLPAIVDIRTWLTSPWTS